MDDGSFEVSSHHRGRDAIVAATGELNDATRHVMQDALSVVLADEPHRVLLDASSLRCSSPACLEPIIDAASCCRRLGIHFRITMGPDLRACFDGVGLAWFGVVNEAPSLDMALEIAVRRARHGFKTEGGQDYARGRRTTGIGEVGEHTHSIRSPETAY